MKKVKKKETKKMSGQTVVPQLCVMVRAMKNSTFPQLLKTPQ